MKKKENILDVLKNGTATTGGNTTIVKSGAFTCNFGDSLDYKAFADAQKKFDRKVKNVCEYGDKKGRSAVMNQPNETAKKLAELLESPQDCRRYYAMYRESLKAPHDIQPYVFENLRILCKEEDAYFVNKPCSLYLASILPPKYIEGWESENLFGYDAEYQVEDLTPTCGMEIGMKVFARHKRQMMQGTITGYEFLPEKIGWVSHAYSPSTPYRYGRYVLHYRVEFSGKYDYECYKIGNLSFVNRETA